MTSGQFNWISAEPNPNWTKDILLRIEYVKNIQQNSWMHITEWWFYYIFNAQHAIRLKCMKWNAMNEVNVNLK